MELSSDLLSLMEPVSPGGWAIGVSGGADSVALLRLLHECRADVSLHVTHLDHQLRGQPSAADAVFVRELAERLNVPFTIATREEIEGRSAALPTNPSARYRALRLALFRQVVHEHHLQGVLLAHHADDVAETVFLRLLRGSGAGGLAGMSPRGNMLGLCIARPLLRAPRERLREYLREIGQPWREDESNVSGKYLRNRVRIALAGAPELGQKLLDLADACGVLRQWVRAQAPVLQPQASLRLLQDLPPVLARESAGRWLVERGAPAGELTPRVIERFLRMGSDAASPPRQHFPGKVLVRRRGGNLLVAER